MSYLGFVKTVLNCYQFQNNCPKILEIGIDKGQSTLPIIQNLATRFENFLYCGVDIKMSNLVIEQASQFAGIAVTKNDLETKRRAIFCEENSLTFLPKLAETSEKFDIVFLDGDHNYFTVSKELKLIEKVIHNKSIIICDDYNGKFSHRDSFYSDKEGYQDIKIATKSKPSEKQGVKTAVDEYARNSSIPWRGFGMTGIEPLILYRGDVWKKVESNRKNNQAIRDCEIRFELIPLTFTVSMQHGKEEK